MTATPIETILTPEHHSLASLALVRRGPNELGLDALGSAAGVPKETDQ
jgi:hypothetical protein